MLVLSRKKNEQIVIDKDIVVTIVDIQNGRVRIGVEAPKDVPILRSELINWKHDGGMTDEQRQAKKSAETIDANLENIGEDTLDADSLSGFVLPADVAAVAQEPKAVVQEPKADDEETSCFVLDHDLAAIVKQPNAGSPKSTEQSVSKSS